RFLTVTLTLFILFFFSSRRRHTRSKRDWSSDVCSSDLIGVVPTKEPFQKLYNQGMILGEGNEKMSKSKGNVVNPDDIVYSHGADTLRLYEMFMGPLDASIAWSENGLDGARRFLDRAW